MVCPRYQTNGEQNFFHNYMDNLHCNFWIMVVIFQSISHRFSLLLHLLMCFHSSSPVRQCCCSSCVLWVIAFFRSKILYAFTFRSHILPTAEVSSASSSNTAYYLRYNIPQSQCHKPHAFRPQPDLTLNSDDTCQTAAQVLLLQQAREWEQTCIVCSCSPSSNISLGNLMLANSNEWQHHLAAPSYPRCLHRAHEITSHCSWARTRKITTCV